MIALNKAAVIDLLAFDTTSGQTRRMSVEGRNFYSLSYRYYGTVLFRTQEGELISKANSITFMPENTSYETEIIEDTKMAVVHFKLDRDIHVCAPATLDVPSKEIPLLFEKLIQGVRVDTPIDFRCMSIFYELLAKLETLTPPNQESHIPHKIALARERMTENFSNPCLSVASIADDLGVSTSYLRREFSKAYGKTPSLFLRDLRITNAKNLLQSEYLSIAQIAEQSGFSSESYFIQVFHSVVGKSPGRYRQQM